MEKMEVAFMNHLGRTFNISDEENEMFCEGYKNIFSDISDYIRGSFTCLHSLHSSLLGVKE